VGWLGVRFADHVVGDGEFATVPFLHGVGDLHLRMVAHLNGNLPELYPAAQQRLIAKPAKSRFREGQDWVEVWDADGVDPCGTHRVRTPSSMTVLERSG
jgi:hypothetical protein